MVEHAVAIERDEDGTWTADFTDLPGLHTQARTLGTLRQRYREVFEDFGPADLEPVFVEDLTGLLPASTADPARVDARRCLEQATAARREADRAQAEAMQATRLAARVLTDAGLTRRDVGELLGVSHQRVQQLVSSS